MNLMRKQLDAYWKLWKTLSQCLRKLLITLRSIKVNGQIKIRKKLKINNYYKVEGENEMITETKIKDVNGEEFVPSSIVRTTDNIIVYEDTKGYRHVIKKNPKNKALTLLEDLRVSMELPPNKFADKIGMSRSTYNWWVKKGHVTNSELGISTVSRVLSVDEEVAREYVLTTTYNVGA